MKHWIPVTDAAAFGEVLTGVQTQLTDVITQLDAVDGAVRLQTNNIKLLQKFVALDVSLNAVLVDLKTIV